jgi:hypothetical protein
MPKFERKDIHKGMFIEGGHYPARYASRPVRYGDPKSGLKTIGQRLDAARAKLNEITTALRAAKQ